MQTPTFEDFRKEPGTTYGRLWSVYSADTGLTLSIPDADVLFEDDDAWKPHEESYQMALRVLAALDGLKQAAIEYLDRVVDGSRHGMHGDSHVELVACDSRTEKVTVALSWETNIYVEWSVTFAWREAEDGVRYHPSAMGMRSR